MAGTAVVKVGENNIRGGREEWWRFSLDPASIAAGAQGIETVAIPGAKAGDPVFAQPEAIETQLIVQGAKVTADDEVSVYLSNAIDATTAINGGAKTWNLHILKRSVGAA